MKYTEKRVRTLLKVITWRVLLTISHTINGLIVTGSLAMGLKIAGWSLVMNSVLYWIHERAWNWWQWNRRPDNNTFFKDGHPRTATKMITWRVIVSFSNFFIPYFMTGSWGQATVFLTISVFINMALFYLHERSWNLIHWGKSAKEQLVEG